MWEVHLLGPQHVLDQLARALAGEDPTVVKVQDRFVLRASAFDSAGTADGVRAEGKRVVESLSGIARLLLDSDEPVSLGSVAEVRSDGSRSIYVQLEGASLRLKGGFASVVVTHADGTVEEHRHSDPASSWLRASLADPSLAKAIRLRDRGDLSWSALYRIFEVIEASVGEKAIVAKGWASKSDIRRFSHSANSVAVGGDASRHGTENTQPPQHTITLREAKTLVDSLLRKWIEEAAA